MMVFALLHQQVALAHSIQSYPILHWYRVLRRLKQLNQIYY